VKLAHLADAHLGIRQYQRLNPAGVNQREADVAQAFRHAIDGVIAARPDAVVIAGDLFHSVRPTNSAIVFAFRQLQRLREVLPEAAIVLIAGNHDTPRSADTGSILRLFEELGVDVATDEARRLVYPALDLSVLAVPHQAVIGADRASLRPAGSERNQVLVLHGEIEGLYRGGEVPTDFGGALIDPQELKAGGWTYVGLGDFHVQYQIALEKKGKKESPIWYAGALEYVSPNFWGDIRLERELGIEGKGWLLVELDSGKATKVQRQRIPQSREIHDLGPLYADGLDAAALSAAIVAEVARVPGGVAEKIVRLVVHNVPRHVARELDHAAIRALKTAALHFRLDLRRPEIHRTVGVGSPGRRQTLPEMVRYYLEHRPLPGDLDRERFVRLGVELMEAVERDLTGT
jgi:DNA repair exonuclease SbcCD nuclease subunit